MERIYLDNAATSWPKPESVYQSVDCYQRTIGASAGRAAYRDAQLAADVVERARRRCASLIGARDPRSIVWAFNGTDALNMALHGLLRPGDRVVTTVCEHNSVLRPLATLREKIQVDTTFIGCDEAGYVDPAELERPLNAGVRLVVVSHASNVTGALQPLAEIAKAARRANALLLVDAAQSFGHVPIDVERLGVDLLASSGHKGGLGPLGTGFLYCRPGIECQLEPFRQGGTGGDTENEFQPAQLPGRFEAGNLNVPAIQGLLAAAEFLAEQSIEAIAQHEATLITQLIDALAQIPGIRLHGPGANQPRVPVVSLAVENYDPQDVAAMLDASFGIQCRAGLHCAPRIHQALGTDVGGGLVRLSPGWSTTEEMIDSAVRALADIAVSAR